MELYKLVDIASASGNRIDAQWGFFITIHLAILGGIIYVDRPLEKVEKLIALVLYCGFSVVNYLGLSHQQDLLEAIIQQIYVLKDDLCCANNLLLQYYVNMVDGGYRDTSRNVALGAHAIAMLVVVVSIITDQAANKNADESAE